MKDIPEMILGRARKVEEALNLIEMIEPHFDDLTSKEHGFVSDMWDRLVRFEGKTCISDKQLFWLRDIKSKYAE